MPTVSGTQSTLVLAIFLFLSVVMHGISRAAEPASTPAQIASPASAVAAVAVSTKSPAPSSVNSSVSVTTVDQILAAENAAVLAKLASKSLATGDVSVISKRSTRFGAEYRDIVIDRIGGVNGNVSYVAGTINGMPFSGPPGNDYHGLTLDRVSGRCAFFSVLSQKNTKTPAPAIKKSVVNKSLKSESSMQVEAPVRFTACWVGVKPQTQIATAPATAILPDGPMPIPTIPSPLPPPK